MYQLIMSSNTSINVSKPQKTKKMCESWMCVQHQLLGLPGGGTFACAKVGLDSMCYENCTTFFSVVLKRKEKILFQNVHFWLFEKRQVSVAHCKYAASKTTKLNEKWVLPVRLFILCDVTFSTFVSKIPFFKATRPQNWCSGLSF